MKQLHIISQLDVDQGKVVTNISQDYQAVFLKQGDLDGACGPYCVMMTLMIMGAINRDDVDELWRVKGNTRLGKLLKAMREHDTLFNSGTTINELRVLIDNSFGRVVTTAANEHKGKHLIPFIISELQEDKPAIVGIINKDMAHWLIAIGYEREQEIITKIFFLDPSGKDTANYWNAAIDIHNTLKGRYPYAWIDHNEDTNEYVQLTEALSLGTL